MARVTGDAELLLDLAVDLARRAGALLVDGQPRERTVVETKSSRTDMVTEMDAAAERLIVEGLRAARPADAILGEEGGEREGSSAVRWVVDPLDGTTNYLYGHPNFAVSIAAEVEGTTVVGVVLAPALDELFSAVRGSGARCNGAPISASDKAELATALIATGFSYQPEERREQARVLEHVLPRVRDVRRIGSAALDLCWVACGRFDGFYERGLQPWDLAAGELIAKEAGAVVTGGVGNVVATAPGIAAEFRALLT
jgi:fructose-1,6-bisphosphatase/inositol monophosphatase family enzyme